MKKICAAFAITLLALQSCNTESSKDGNIKISGEIKGLKQGTLYLQQLKDNQLNTLDSVVIKGNSKFETVINLPEAEMIYLTLDRGTSLSEDNYIMFFAEPGTINISSSLERFYGDAKIEGSNNQKIYDTYLESKKRITDKKNDLIKDQLMAVKSNNIKVADSLHKMLVSSEKRLYYNAVNFAKKNNQSVASAYIVLTDVLPYSDKYIDSLYNNFSQEVKNNKYGKLISEYQKIQQPTR